MQGWHSHLRSPCITKFKLVTQGIKKKAVTRKRGVV